MTKKAIAAAAITALAVQPKRFSQTPFTLTLVTLGLCPYAS